MTCRDDFERWADMVLRVFSTQQIISLEAVLSIPDISRYCNDRMVEILKCASTLKLWSKQNNLVEESLFAIVTGLRYPPFSNFFQNTSESLKLHIFHIPYLVPLWLQAPRQDLSFIHTTQWIIQGPRSISFQTWSCSFVQSEILFLESSDLAQSLYPGFEREPKSEIKYGPPKSPFHQQFYNIWLSLLGTGICAAVMFLIQWYVALATFAVTLILYLYVSYRRPGGSILYHDILPRAFFFIFPDANSFLCISYWMQMRTGARAHKQLRARTHWDTCKAWIEWKITWRRTGPRSWSLPDIRALDQHSWTLLIWSPSLTPF